MSAVYNDGMICNFNLNQILDKNYNTLTVKLWVINSSTESTKFNMYGCKTSDCLTYATQYTEVIAGGLDYAPTKMQIETFTLKNANPTGTASISVKLNTGTEVTGLLYAGTKFNLLMKFTGTNFDQNQLLKLSYFQINSNNLGGEYTLYGTPKTCADSSECLPGYVCKTDTSTNTKRCMTGVVPNSLHPSCRLQFKNALTKFKDNFDYMECQTCSAISSKWNLVPNGPDYCLPLDYLDLTQLDMTTPIKMPFSARYTNAYTLGFWMFINNDVALTNTDVIRIELDQFLSIHIGKTTSGNTGAICNVYSGLYPQLKDYTNFKDVETYMENTNDNGINNEIFYRNVYKKINFNNSVSGKWFYSRCGYSQERNYLNNQLSYNNLLKNGDYTYINGEITNMRPNFFSMGSANPMDYIPRQLLGTSEVMNLTINVSTATSKVYTRNIILFSDFIPTEVGLQYYNFKGLASNAAFPSLLLVANMDNIELRQTDQTYSAANSNPTKRTIEFFYYTSADNNKNSPVFADVPSYVVKATSDFSVPKNFYRLNFIDYSTNPTKFFNNANLDSTLLSSYHCYDSYNLLDCWQYNRGTSCKNTYFWTGVDTCAKKCTTGTYPTLLVSNVTPTRGYCNNYQSVTNIDWLYDDTNTVYKGIATDADLQANLACKTGFTQIYLTCYDSNVKEDGSLFYSSYQNPYPITLTVTQINNYYISIWFWADKVFLPRPAIAGKSYIFYTDALKIYRTGDYTLDNVYAMEYFTTDSTPVSTVIFSNLQFKYAQWTRIVYKVTKTTVGGVDNWSVSMLLKPTDLLKTAITRDLSLSKIYFSHAASSGVMNGINWSSGYYRKLQIYKSEEIYTDQYKEYERYFSPYQTTYLHPKQSALYAYYPLSFKYQEDATAFTGKISDPYSLGGTYSYTADSARDNLYGANYKKRLAPWSPAFTFDIYRTNQGKVIDSFATHPNNVWKVNQPNLINCADNCKYCNSKECIECNDDSVLNRLTWDGTCFKPTAPSKVRFYLISPGFDKTKVAADGSLTLPPQLPMDIRLKQVFKETTFNADLTVNVAGTTPMTSLRGITVSFFVKLLGWNVSSGSKYDVFRYSIAPTGSVKKFAVRLSFDTSTDVRNLEFYSCDSTCTTQVVHAVKDVKALMGKWFRISVSYKYDSTNLRALMNIQIDDDNLVVANDYTNILFNDNFEIPKESVGLYAKLWVWDTYLQGSWGYMTNQDAVGIIKPIKFIDDALANDDPANCSKQLIIDSTYSTTNGWKCVKDYDVMLDENKYYVKYKTNKFSFLDYKIDRANGENVDANINYCPYGMYANDFTCSCSNKDPDTVILTDAAATVTIAAASVTGNKDSCLKVDYLDFGKFDATTEVTYSDALTTTYTMQFWVFVDHYLYTISDAKYTTGVELAWNHNVKVAVKWDTTKSKFVAVCTPNDPNTFSASIDLVEQFTNWIYIRCSADISTGNTTSGKYYFVQTTDFDLVRDSSVDAAITGVSTGSRSLNKFKISSQQNIAVVFVRQIRLTKCFDCREVYSQKEIYVTNSVFTNAQILAAYDPFLPPKIDNPNRIPNYDPVDRTNSPTYSIKNLVPGANVNTYFTATITTSWTGMNRLDKSFETRYRSLYPSNVPYFPETTPQPQDMVRKPSEDPANYIGETLIEAHVFSTTAGITLQDTRNAITVSEYADVK